MPSTDGTGTTSINGTNPESILISSSLTNRHTHTREKIMRILTMRCSNVSTTMRTTSITTGRQSIGQRVLSSKRTESRSNQSMSGMPSRQLTAADSDGFSSIRPWFPRPARQCDRFDTALRLQNQLPRMLREVLNLSSL